MAAPSNIKYVRHASIYLAILIFVASFGIQWYLIQKDYNNFIDSTINEKISLMEGTASAIAANIDGSAYATMLEEKDKEQSIENNQADPTYFKIHQTLLKARNQSLNRFNLAVDFYTVNVILEGTEYKKSYGVNTISFPWYRRPFDINPGFRIEGFKSGGNLSVPYTHKDVQYIAAFAPIVDDNENVIAFVYGQTEYGNIQALADEYFYELIFNHSIILLLLVAALVSFLTVVMRFSGRERRAANINTQKLTDTYNIIEEFVENVKKGDYKTKLNFGEYKADNLAKSLDVLHKKLADNAISAGERNWIAEGRLQIASILRLHNDFEALSLEVVMELVKYVNAVQGAFYIASGDGDDLSIDMIAKYAYNRRKYDMTSYKVGQGLIGQCAFEMATIYRTEIPEDYVTISSGILGDKKPSSILIVPLVTNDKLHGIVEIASLRKLKPIEIKFVEELSDIIARTIFNLKTNIRTQELLEESLEKGKVLEQQQGELKRQQDELEVSNTRLQEQIEEVNRSQRKMHSLLENSSEIITIYGEDGKISYESPSVTSILGYDANELLGTRDLDRVSADGKRAIKELFDTLLQDPSKTPVIQFEYKRKDGSYVWLEAIGKNLIHDPAINGIVLNSRDITERRKAEREQIMRGRMQALSENSPDIIIRFDLEGNFLYTNPMLEEFTKIPQAEFNKTNVHEIGLDETIITGWTDIIEELKEKPVNLAREMDFPTEDGNHIMQVNAIPEFDDQNKLDTVLLVSHDITERKTQEIVIQEANKKITDSINYAKRIQNSIIPDNDIIRELMPDSFIFYKPKDVVSGDFPWFFQRGDDMYYAAVDCTGHGVPGAMMSLIGYFLLNEITGHREAYDTATVLNKLNDMVRKTLRQDREGAQARDGMDVALCKINLKEKTVQYSGAHRPLYLVRDGELVQFKGTRKAIGGTSTKGDREFTNHDLEIHDGDSIYFFSDGLPDQFGGERGLKYSPRRIRELAVENEGNKMDQVHDVFANDFQEWMGDRKQIDDVLLIGIRF